ncbi:MAG: hypothetical protein LUI87_05435, partial [Lachnospiraceae bacterium]|nr:hypothetical protein [Lachnospiraceae bacterium]
LILITIQGLMYQTESCVDVEAYKTYKPGRFDYRPAVADYPNIKEKDFIKLIEDVIAYMILYSFNDQREMKELFYPSLRCETDMCVEDEKFDDEIKLIIKKMEQNNFKDAATYALDLYKKNPGNKIPYIFYLAILKNAQDSIRPDWFEEYSKVRKCNINRSDVLLEAGKISRSRTQAIMELPDNSVFEFYCKAASMGNWEAIDFVSLMCKRDFLWGVNKAWAEQWSELKNSCTKDKTNIFSLVGGLYLKNGNKVAQNTQEMPKDIHNVTRTKRYYDEDFNLEKRKNIFNKLSVFLNDELSWKCQTYLTDGECLEQNKRVETAIRNYYKIPQSETIYAFVDAGLPSRVNRGLVFTESAIYCVDKDHKLNRIAWNRLTFADKIYEDRFMGFYFNGKRLFGNEENKTRQICRYIDYGINPNRNYDLFGNNDIKSL